MCNKAEMIFSIYLIYQLAQSWKKKPTEVFEILNSTKILDDYIIKHYDVLHTQGNLTLIEDLSEFVKEKGVQI